MKNNTKSSITLPPAEVRLVEELMKRTGAKTKVEVIRLGLRQLKETTDRRILKEAYRTAAKATRASTVEELRELDTLTGEGLDRE